MREPPAETRWQQWAKRPEIEQTLADRATGLLPEMQSTEQLVNLVQEVYEPGMSVLDVGCNVGHYLRGLRRISRQLDYTGVDAYEHYIEQARAIFSDDEYARFEVRDIHEPLFPGRVFDIVFCCNVILHLPDFRLPIQNLLDATKSVCLIRMLLGERSTIVRRAVTEEFDESGEPLEFIYQNTWARETVLQHVRALGWNAQLIEDQFDPAVLDEEFQNVKQGRGTRIVGGLQVDGVVLFQWGWLKINAPSLADRHETRL